MKTATGKPGDVTSSAFETAMAKLCDAQGIFKKVPSPANRKRRDKALERAVAAKPKPEPDKTS
jgi:hypothetical protein